MADATGWSTREKLGKKKHFSTHIYKVETEKSSLRRLYNGLIYVSIRAIFKKNLRNKLMNKLANHDVNLYMVTSFQVFDCIYLYYTYSRVHVAHTA